MTDIAERLRTEEPSYVLLGDAAIEIDRLRRQVDFLNRIIDQKLEKMAPDKVIKYG